MTSRDRVKAIFNRSGGPGFWLGNPTDEAKQKLFDHFGISETVQTAKPAMDGLLNTDYGAADIELALAMKSDVVWFTPEYVPGCWRHPQNKPMFDVLGGKPRMSLGQPGVFAQTQSVAEVDAFDWPDPALMDYSVTLDLIDRANERGLAVFSGMWAPFFHITADFFGMENYFIKMYTDPEVVHAVSRHVTDFYLQTNDTFFKLVGDRIDVGFFGNDLGSQLDTLISPDSFKEFVLPYIKQLVEQIHSFGLKAAMHSCGAVDKFIPMLIDAGVDALHPLQAKAANMDAEHLAREYKNDLVFVGGLDTQQLLAFGTPQQIRDEAQRLREVFGEGFILSPSHEAILPNVPLENILAMIPQ